MLMVLHGNTDANKEPFFFKSVHFGVLVVFGSMLFSMRQSKKLRGGAHYE